MSNQIFDHKGAEMRIEAFHPGEFLAEEIEFRNIKKKDVADELGILPNNLSQILAGKRNISASLALKLERLLGISAEYWYNLQTAYELQQAREELELTEH